MEKHRHVFFAALLAATVMAVPLSSRAQEGSDSDDPIVEMLDSLVSQVYADKLSGQSDDAGSRYAPYEIPTYDDDIYGKRIENIRTPIPLTFNDEVKQYIDLYAVKKRGLTERVMGLSTLYFPQFEEILDQQGLPLEFKYLSVVESALNPVAVSRVGATGLWQFMLNTGRLYDLKVTSYVDERKDPYKATLAACRYFKDMYAIYKDWLLVIASYNCGPGNVNKAIARSGGKTDFWEISPYLPRETRGYVPAFIAVTYLMHYAAEHNLSPVPPSISYYEADTVMVHQRVSLKQVAASVNMPEELLRYLNPEYKKGIIPEMEEPCVLRLPSNRLNAYFASLNSIFVPEDIDAASPVATTAGKGNYDYVTKTVKKVHSVRRGENLSIIASRYDCSVTDLKHWNRLRSTRIAQGQRLAVYVTVREKVAVKTAPSNVSVQPHDDTVLNKEIPGDTSARNAATNNSALTAQASPGPAAAVKGDEKIQYHVVQPGDTLWNIALRYDGVTVQELRRINGLSSNSNALKVGTRLKVTVGS
jgi:membrane-bound lytic murein transglycosylase D